ncbi:MAG: esterase/lipase family protein [Longimicrobiaceae bacterium]
MSILQRISPPRLLAGAVRRVGSIFQLGNAESPLLAFERILGKPGMRPLPDRSLHPDLAQAPRLETLEEFRDLVKALRQERGREEIPGGNPVLILVHGIFDRVYGAAFSPLLVWGDLLERLQAKYGNRVYGYDHETLALGPLENARDLISRLPAHTEIEILCHSRGGLVVRALLQHPECQASLRARQIKIRNVVFMGAANHGSPLAEPGKTDELLTMFTHLFHARAPAEGPAAHLKLIVQTVRVLGRRAADLPGIAALRPDSKLIRGLSSAVLPDGVRCTFVRANFGNAVDNRLQEPEGISDSVFGSTLNDLVVPFEGMTKMGGVSPTDGQIVTLDNAGTPQGDFYHLNYLDSSKVRERIVRDLIGS